MFKPQAILVTFFILFLLAGFEITHAQSKVPRIDSAYLIKLDVEKRVRQLIDASIYYNDSLNLATKLALDALELSLKSKDKSLEAYSKTNLATLLLIYDQYDQALVFGFEALKLFEETNDAKGKTKVLGELGWIYYDADQPDIALRYHRDVVDYYETQHDYDNLTWSYNAIGLDYFRKKTYDSAIQYFQKSLALGKQLNAEHRISAGYNNLGMAYSAINEFRKALEMLDSAIRINHNSGRELEIAENLNQKGYVFVKTNQLNEAKALLEQARKILDSSPSNAKKEQMLDNFDFSSKLFQRKGDFEQALLYQSKYNGMKEEILSVDKNSKLINAQHLFAAKQREHEIELLEAENQIKVLERNFIAGTFLLLGIIGFMLHQRKVNNQRKEIQIKEAKQALIEKELERASLEKESIEKEYKLTETQKLLAQAELEKANIEKENLENKLQFKNTEFTKAAIHLSQRNELIRSFLEELKNINTQQPANLASRISKLISHFSVVQGINSDAENFHLNMEAEYKEFLYRLTNKFPDLTENEKRLCSQIRLNLSIKDIASINNISVKSVEMARYRLRKKLGLEHDEGLGDFLNKL